MSYTRVVASLKELFGRSPKTKTPVAAGALVPSTEEVTDMFSGNDNGNGSGSTAKGKTSFTKHLRWKLKTKERETNIKITPAMATEMLAYNDRNVPVKPGKLAHFVRQFTEGRWVYTYEPIAFSEKGRLVNGQHRLMACAESGVPFRADIAYGVPDDCFYFVDQFGRPGKDSFAINGVPNYQMAYSATRFLVAYEKGSTSGDSALGSVTLSPKEVHEHYERFDNLQESVKVGHRFARDRLPAPAIAAGVHYICAQKSRAAADEYFDKVITGVGFSTTRDPAKKVRDFLVRSDGTKRRRNEVAAALIQGWNAIRTRKPLTRIDTGKIGRVI